MIKYDKKIIILLLYFLIIFYTKCVQYIFNIILFLNILHYPKLYETSLIYSYFVVHAEFINNVICRPFYSMINFYKIGPINVKKVDVETIKHKNNSKNICDLYFILINK